MTNKELNTIKIMTMIMHICQHIVYGIVDISQINYHYKGLIYDSKNENKIVASYIPEQSLILEYWEDLYEISCRLIENNIGTQYVQISFISEEDEEFDILIDMEGNIS